MEKLFEFYNKESYNKIYSDNNSINIVKIQNNMVYHKQIERKGEMLFMRMKKRDLTSCS